MLSADAIQQLVALVAALASLVTCVTLLIKQVQLSAKVEQVHLNTNSTLAALMARADAAQDKQATAVELAARPAVPLVS